MSNVLLDNEEGIRKWLKHDFQYLEELTTLWGSSTHIYKKLVNNKTNCNECQQVGTACNIMECGREYSKASFGLSEEECSTAQSQPRHWYVALAIKVSAS